MNLESIKNIYFVGIGGIGISAVAKLMKLEGKAVSGSDISESEVLDELRDLGIQIFTGHKEENLAEDADFVVYSSAVPDSNPEREKAKRKNIPQLSYFEFLGELSRGKKTIAVSGTHGKSTTTAMLGLMLEAADFDPTVIVGSKVKNFPYQNLRFGKGEYLVVEACEHFKNFIHLHPQYLIINNIELDHTDCYKNLDEVEDAFVSLAQKIPAGDIVLLNNDNQGAMNVYKKLNNPPKFPPYFKGGQGGVIKKFGLTPNNVDWLAYDVSSTEGEQKFKIKKTPTFSPPVPHSHTSEGIGGDRGGFGEFTLRVPGRFNIYNALAAAALAMELGAPSGIVKKVLAEFNGIWRRFEKVGERDGTIIISDYGHHPTAIKETIKAARDFYPLRRIVLAFQPHQHNRTKNLFNDFVDALAEPDFLILSDIFDVAGREEGADKDTNSYELIKAIREKYPQKTNTSIYGGNLEKTTQEILKSAQPNDLIIVMGAGDIYTIIPKILQLKSSK
jgi:UDP-N-acetylmuramate--alanine ligase